MKESKVYLPMVVLIVCAAEVFAQDWPQYLGPNRNSVSDQKGILRSWPETGPEVLWSVGVGIGFGGPVVKDGKVYLLDRDDQVGDNLRCFDLYSGEERWNFHYESPGSVMFPGSRSVPALDDTLLYTCGHNGELYCIDIQTHEPIWNRNLWTDFGGEEIPRWAISQCPLVYGDLLILASQAPQAGVVAYDKLNGEVRWTTPSLGPVGYVSPTIVRVGGEDHIVMITAATGGRGTPATGGKVVGIEPHSGKILWEYSNWQCHIPVPGAIDAGGGRMLIIGGYQAGAAMIQVEKETDDSHRVTELFKTVEFGEHTKPAILHDGYFYAQYSTNERRDGLVCMSMDGRIMWQTKRSPAFDKGSMILADGLILATDGASTLYLIEPDSTGFRPLASAVVLAEAEQSDDPMAESFGTQNWAPMALAEGRLLIRDQNRLMCIRVAE
jgi:outer membrane protein assembly factor BamB